MSQNGSILRVQGNRAHAEPSLAELLDPVALEARLTVARARRADAIARRADATAGAGRPLPAHGAPAGAGPQQAKAEARPEVRPETHRPALSPRPPPSAGPRRLPNDLSPLAAPPPLAAKPEVPRTLVGPRRFAARLPVALALGIATGVVGATATMMLAPHLPWDRFADGGAPQSVSASGPRAGAALPANHDAPTAPQPPAAVPSVVVDAPPGSRMPASRAPELKDFAAVGVAPPVTATPGHLPIGSSVPPPAPSAVETPPLGPPVPAAAGVVEPGAREGSAVATVATPPAGGRLSGPANLPAAPSVHAEAPAANLPAVGALRTPRGAPAGIARVAALAASLGSGLAAAPSADRPPTIPTEAGRFGVRSPLRFAVPPTAGRARVALVLPGGDPARGDAVGYALPTPPARATKAPQRDTPATLSRVVRRVTPTAAASAKQVERIVLERTVEDMLRERLRRR